MNTIIDEVSKLYNDVVLISERLYLIQCSDLKVILRTTGDFGSVFVSESSMDVRGNISYHIGFLMKIKLEGTRELLVRVSSVDMLEKSIYVTLDSNGMGRLKFGGTDKEIDSILGGDRYTREIRGIFYEVRRMSGMSGNKNLLMKVGDWIEVSSNFKMDGYALYDIECGYYVRVELDGWIHSGYMLKRSATFFVLLCGQDKPKYCVVRDGLVIDGDLSIINKRLL